MGMASPVGPPFFLRGKKEVLNTETPQKKKKKKKLTNTASPQEKGVLANHDGDGGETVTKQKV